MLVDQQEEGLGGVQLQPTPGREEEEEEEVELHHFIMMLTSCSFTVNNQTESKPSLFNDKAI